MYATSVWLSSLPGRSYCTHYFKCRVKWEKSCSLCVCSWRPFAPLSSLSPESYLRQDNRTLESTSLSTISNADNGSIPAAALEAQQKSLATSQTLEQEIAAKFNLQNPHAARVWAQVALKLMAVLRRNQQQQRREGEGIA